MSDALWEVQDQWLHDTLSVDATLLALAPGGVHDEPPPAPTQDYVLIGEFTEIPDSIHGETRREVTVTLHVYSFALGNENLLAIKARIFGLLNQQGPQLLTNWRIASAFQDLADTLKERDPVSNTTIRHAVLRYRIFLKAT